MDATTLHATVLILYSHPLLGLGLARLLASEPDLDVVSVDVNEHESTAAALDARPDVVILERGTESLDAATILNASPDALIIDVGMDAGPNFSLHREELESKPEGILDAIRHLRGARHTIAGAFAVITCPRL